MYICTPFLIMDILNSTLDTPQLQATIIMLYVLENTCSYYGVI